MRPTHNKKGHPGEPGCPFSSVCPHLTLSLCERGVPFRARGGKSSLRAFHRIAEDADAGNLNLGRVARLKLRR